MNSRIDLAKAYPLPAPLRLFIETTSACNFRCVMCPHSLPDFASRAKRRAMDDTTWDKIMSDISEWCRLKVIQLYVTGEPLLDRSIGERIRRAHQVSDRVELTSNASLLTEQAAWALVEAGLDAYQVSVYSTTDEGYRAQTQSKYGMREALDNVRALRDVRKNGKPHIHARLVTVTPGQETAFREQWDGIADEISVRELSN